MTDRNVRPVDALAADGRIVRLRRTTADDVPALLAMHDDCTASDLRQRFFATGSGIVSSEVGRLVGLNTSGDGAAIVAVDDGIPVGAASFERYPERPERAELGLIVVPGHQHRGIGTLMLEHLAGIAASEGVKELSGQILAGNTPMLRLAKSLAPGTAMPFQDGVVDLLLTADLDEALAEDIAGRERAAERHSLRPLLEPRSVAIVGASRSGRGVGHEVLLSIIDGGFNGPIYPIHPISTELAGLPAYASLSDLPGPLDLVIVAVPAPAVAAVIHDAGTAGARAAVILSSGFAETGDTTAQAELVRIARDHHMRLVGPNCLGIVNTDSHVRLQGSFAVEAPVAGGLALASQSGAVGIAALAHATRTGLGVHSFVSLGNKADVSGNDLLSYWYDDPDCKAVALYLESFGNPRKFARVARAVARRKPVLAVKGGRSDSGRRAGLSHTAAAANSDTAVASLFSQAGVIRTDTLEAMIDTARVLVDQPLPKGGRIGVVGNAGGVGVLAVDAAAASGLDAPALSDGARRSLAAAVEDAASPDNPIDLGAAASPEAYIDAIAALGDTGEVDALVAVFAATRTNDITGNLDAIAEALDALPDLPAAAVVMGLSNAPTSLGDRKIPVFDFPEDAVAALARAVAYGAWRERPLGRRPELPGIDPAGARATVERMLAAGEGWKLAAEAIELLECYGIPVVTTEPVDTKRDAVRAAHALGYPVAVKADDTRLIHKSDAGAVHLGLTYDAEVRSAFKHVSDVIEGDGGTVVVQPMVEAGVELVAGVTHDPLFGSLIMFGLGGVHTDVLGDKGFRLLPITDTDVDSMWRSLKASKLLTGHRGSAPVDLEALTDLLARLGRLAEDFPEIAELDLNPIMAGPDGVRVVDVKLRLARIGDEPDAVARRLR
ncbi:bifunctional GNAT family N-acetyltransferase/acetate--CoA ligase family protein [Glycomyces sp. L485]|uniref:bifunctional acetate--CoA ligase family protein/GNAT family N-acetyltransferase n=1 Tax=Glycomyces sp. L485 TaxID=2909235 RepID=UPI001F4BB944|nr:bifunctional GNAT family N-acetyltransferase/acetate--CoA ligase family protein [Glycomyces sp. L485]MCH7229795.1 bifunctional GNAT family N-acetyltransferase/acetate--CoA ligase family protein [Glycomyces sp. L485]